MHQLNIVASHRPELDGTVRENPHLGYYEVLETVTAAWVSLLGKTGFEDLAMSYFATVNVTADYRREMFVGELDTDTVLERIGTTSLTFATSVAQGGHDAGAVRITLVKIGKDRTIAVPFTEEQRAALEDLR